MKRKRVLIISPNIVTQTDDLFGSGIPYLPLTSAYLASHLRSIGHEIHFIDTFGEDPHNIRKRANYYYQGISAEQLLAKLEGKYDLCCIVAERLVAHASLLEMLEALRSKYPVLPILICENTQAVTSYSLRGIAKDLIAAGATHVLIGEPEFGVEQFLNGEHEVPGLVSGKKNVRVPISDLDRLAFPAWDLVKLENYWKLGYAHAPLSAKKYLPLLTSRGCTFRCRFCVTPETNGMRWRPRSASNVVDEIEYCIKHYGVREFHVEDLNPTIDKKRIEDMAKLIIERKLDITWKIGSGTKIETVGLETLSLMAQSGCSYVSMSPESGSQEVLKLIAKPFNHAFGLDAARHMHRKHMVTQACFVLGFPGETDMDRAKTWKYALKLTRAGVDELALFIIAPVPGAAIYDEFQKEAPQKLENLTFSPTWRKEYRKLNVFRTKLYVMFFLTRLLYHPIALARDVWSVFSGKFYTKMPMTLYRAIKIRIIARGIKA